MFRTLTILLLLFGLAGSVSAQSSTELTRELYALDLDRVNNDKLPRLIEAQAAIERLANAGDAQAARLIKYVVLLRQLAQLQDGRGTVLRGRDGGIRGADPKAETARVRSALDALRAGRAPRVELPAETAPQPGRVRRLLNREVSFLAFNERVLAQAADKTVPPLERLRFLTIASSNLDEFFQVRVSGLQEEVALGRKAPRADGYSPSETLETIRADARRLVAEQYRLLNEEVLPQLNSKGVGVELDRSRWDRTTKAFAAAEFEALKGDLKVIPVTEGLPHVTDRSLNLLVTLADGKRAVIQLPSKSAPALEVPGSGKFVTTNSIVREHVGKLFPGATVTQVSPFRVTRNSDLWGRTGVAVRYGDASRLEVEATIDPKEAEFLRRSLALDARDVLKVNGPVDLKRLGPVVDADSKLTYARTPPSRPANLPEGANVFEAVTRGDVLLHHPFQSYDPVVEMLEQAATDPKVETIRQTLYRTGNAQEGVVDALVTAAKNGKQVEVLVETRARFDELNNSEVTRRLTEAGAKVVFGPPGLKTHAKMLLIERREGRRLQRYVHLGTGNYNPGTAKIYTDFSFFTRNAAIGNDAARVFEQLSGAKTTAGAPRLGKLLQAPYTLQSTLIARIAHEAEEARAGRPARIVAKMNSLNDPKLIEALYAASQAGVKIDLVVRGVNTLRAGVPGLSENIQVRSVIGRFLEHTRVFQFHDGGRKTTYLASADWMVRNTERRVELAFPVEDKALKSQVDKILGTYLADNAKAWVLGPDGRYRRVTPQPGAPVRNAQEELAARRGVATGEGVAVDRLAPYRRADGTLKWTALTRDSALRQTAGLAHFGLALFLKEVAIVAATGDRERIQEFFDGLMTTDFYKHYGLFVAGARVTEVAYTKYLQRHIRPGFVNGLLKTNLVLAAGLALPMIAEGKFSGKTLAISLGSLGLSSAAVRGGIQGIKWVTGLDKARQAGLLGKAASAGRLARLGGWFYTAAELAVILFVAEKLETRVYAALDAKAARDALGKAGEAFLAAINDPKATPESVRAASEAYHTAWGDYRNYLYRPLDIEEARFSERLSKLAREAKLAHDTVAAAERLKTRGSDAMRLAMQRAARTREARARSELAAKSAEAFAAYEKRRQDLLTEVYEGNRREGSLLADLDDLPWLLDGAPTGAANDPYADAMVPLSATLGRRRARASLTDALRSPSSNRLQTYADEGALLAAVAKRLEARGQADLAAEVKTTAALALKTSKLDAALYRDGVVTGDAEGARGKLTSAVGE